MRHGSTGFRFSASDLSGFAECEHLAWLDGQEARGLRAPNANPRDPMANLLARRGLAHEQRYLAQLEARGVEVTRIAHDPAHDAPAVAATFAAMRRGDAVLYQAVLEDGPWFGIADFVERVERPSALGAWSYEAADAKLARRTKGHYLLQLSLYSELIARVQGVAPAHMHVLLGDDAGPEQVRRDTYACRDFGAYFRALRGRFETVVSAPGEPSYPLPVPFCGLCRWEATCAARRESDDHLCRVANIRRTQIAHLARAGVHTMAELGVLPETRAVPRIPRDTLERLREQARLQTAQAADGEPHYELLRPAAGHGFDLLPAPSAGDVCFDMEGDPYCAPRGLEYLFGATFDAGGGAWTYRAWWAHDRAEERHAFEAFVDFVSARQREHPDLHVYHYAPYETAALKRLAGWFGTREAELDDLLRGQVFVDLYTVVRQGLRASFPSYSIKDIEHFYMGPRQAEVKKAGDSIVEYELWLESGDRSKLEAIERYNEEDCVSTRKLRDWLLARRAEAYARFGPPPAPPLPAEPAKPRDPERERVAQEHARLVAQLTQDLAADPSALTGAERARWLLAQLLDYHQREARPPWWEFFARRERTLEELTDEDTEAIGGLVPDPATPAAPMDRSTAYAFTFPAQEMKLDAGDDVLDPATGKAAGRIVALDAAAGRLVLKRGKSLDGVPLPRAIIPGGPYDTREQRAALRRIAASVVAHGVAGPGPFRAVRDLLLAAPPRVAGLAPHADLQGAHLELDDAWRIVRGLEDSAVFVQGPPGAGKTWLGARLIVRLLRAGKRVGVTAVPHRVIHNLLDEVEEVAAAEHVEFRGLKKCSGGGGPDDESAFRSKQPRPFIENIGENPAGWPPGAHLLAGTAWLFARAPLDGTLDYLFIDEAGQVSLADALAVGTSAANLVLLGDPQQLAQVAQAVHPSGAGASVLQHVLRGHDTVPRDRGLFLDRSWRMHPDVCRFISELAYEERLQSAPGRERQRIDAPGGLAGAGLFFLPVEHRGNTQRSIEEAERIALEFERLLARGTYTDAEGATRRLGHEDILVVAPYNAQVRQLLATLPKGAQVGTVDKFQGRGAPVVFYSMATSGGGDDPPHGIEFLYSRHRLNVAISRAKALAVLVASRLLLQARCDGAAEMRMVNGVCRYVEVARDGEG